MSVSISGILLDPFGQPASFAEVKFITWQGANDVLTTAPAVFKTSADGAYSFAVEFGTFTVQVRYNQSNGKFQTIKQKVIVNSNVTATTLGELLLFNEPLTPPEIAYVEQLVAEAEGYRDEAEGFAQASEASSQASEGFSQASSGYADDANQSAIDAANSAAAIVGVPLNGGVWAAGQTFDFYNQYMIYNGTPLAPLASTPLPYGPVGATPDFALVGPYPLNDALALSNFGEAAAEVSSLQAANVDDIIAGFTVGGGAAIDHRVGQVWAANDYYGGLTPNNSGVLFFKVVAAGTGAHDGGKYIDIDSNFQLEQNLSTPFQVKAWGAKGGGVSFDNSPFFQTVVNYSIANNVKRIFIPMANGEQYYFESTVAINASGFLIEGNAPVRYLHDSEDTTNSYLFGSPSIDAIFDYGDNQGVAPSAQQFTVSGVSAKGFNNAGQSFIKCTRKSNGPDRAHLYEKCSIVRFENGILFDNNSSVLAAATVRVSECVIDRNSSAGLRADDRVLGLEFTGNQAENGGRIVGNFDAGVLISNNMGEANENWVDITSSAPNIVISGNYVEANRGEYIYRVRGTTSEATVELGKDFVSNYTATDYYNISSVKAVQTWNSRTRVGLPIITLAGQLTPGSNIYPQIMTDTSVACQGFVDQEKVSSRAAPANSVIRKTLGSDSVWTPFGETATASVRTTSGSLGNISINATTDDLIYFCFLVKADAGAEDLRITATNQDAQNIVPSGGSVYTAGGALLSVELDDTWSIIFAAFKPVVDITSLNFRAGPNGTSPSTFRFTFAALGAAVVDQSDLVTRNSQERAIVNLFNPFLGTQ